MSTWWEVLTVSSSADPFRLTQNVQWLAAPSVDPMEYARERFRLVVNGWSPAITPDRVAAWRQEWALLLLEIREGTPDGPLIGCVYHCFGHSAGEVDAAAEALEREIITDAVRAGGDSRQLVVDTLRELGWTVQAPDGDDDGASQDQ